MNGVLAGHVLHVLQVRNLQRAYRLDGGSQRFVDTSASPLLAQGLSRRA